MDSWKVVLFDCDEPNLEKYTDFSRRKLKKDGGRALYEWSIRQYDNEIKLTNDQMQQIVDLWNGRDK